MRIRTIVFISLPLLSLLFVLQVSALDIDGSALNMARDSKTSLAVTPHALNPFLTFRENTPYVTWTEMDANGISRIYVRHKEGKEWVLDGGLLNQSLTGHVASPALASVGNHLYVAWSEVDTKHISQVYIKEWDGEKWLQKWGGININPANSASSPVLSGNDSSLYIAWTELNSAGISLIQVKQWDGNSWKPLGDSINRNAKRHALTPSLAGGKDSVYLAWAEYDDQSIAKIYVNRWDGKQWEPLGETVNTDPERHALSPSLSLAGSSPYIAWMEYNTEGVSQIYVKRWNGKEWVQIGGSLNGNSSMHASVPSLCMKGGIPYVAWTEIDNTGIPNVYLKGWRRHSWLQADRALNIDMERAAAAPFIAVNDDTIYIAFIQIDERGIYQLYVKELNNTDFHETAQGNSKSTSSPVLSAQGGEKKKGRTFFTSMPKDPKAKDFPPPLAFKNLPRTPMGEVNWMEGIRGGLLKPFDSTDPEARPPLSLNLDILLPVKKEFGIPDVVFPHLSHSMWLDCRNCHPTIFAPKRGGNPITMHRILEGEYCGRCHGVVAFRLYDCFRCHSSPSE